MSESGPGFLFVFVACVVFSLLVFGRARLVVSIDLFFSAFTFLLFFQFSFIELWLSI